MASNNGPTRCANRRVSRRMWRFGSLKNGIKVIRIWYIFMLRRLCICMTTVYKPALKLRLRPWSACFIVHPRSTIRWHVTRKIPLSEYTRVNNVKYIPKWRRRRWRRRTFRIKLSNIKYQVVMIILMHCLLRAPLFIGFRRRSGKPPGSNDQTIVQYQSTV